MPRQFPPPLFVLLHDRVDLLESEGKLVKELDSQSRVDQRADDFAEGVLPLVCRGLDYLCACVALLAALEEQLVVEVPVRRDHVTRFRQLERVRERMEFNDVEDAARLEMSVYDLCPSSNIGQPDQDTVGGEDNVKLLVQYSGKS